MATGLRSAARWVYSDLIPRESERPMARTFVFSDDMAVRAEVICTDDVEYGQWTYVCEVHDLMRDPRELSQFDSSEEAREAAGIHVDGCRLVGHE